MKEQRFYCIGIHKRCNVKEKDEGEVSRWPYLPKEDPDIIVLGKPCKLWSVALPWCVALRQKQLSMEI